MQRTNVRSQIPVELREVATVPERLNGRALVVLGMHRSGTSAMTRTLSLLGAGLPKQLMPTHGDNPAGFWEAQSVANLNDQILHALDSEWDDIFAFRPKEYLSNVDQFHLGQAVDVLAEEFDGSQLIVLKDPRISILTRFWDRALQKAGYAPHYIIMVRNPLEVAESLRSRDQFPREKSLLLWSSYMIAADRDTRDRNRTFVSYDQLMSDWRGVKRRIEESTGIPFPRDTSAAANDVDRHLDSGLRHHRAEADDVASRPDIPEEVRTLYRIFVDACEGAEIDRAAVSAIEAKLAKMDRMVGPLLADYRGRVRGLIRDVADLNEAHAGASSRAAILEQELATERAVSQEKADAAVKTAAALESQVADLTSSYEAIETQRDRLAGELEEKTREGFEINARFIAIEAERDRLATEAAELAKKIIAAEEQRDRAVLQAEAERSRANQIDSQLDAARREAELLLTASAEAESRNKQLDGQVRETQSELQRLKEKRANELCDADEARNKAKLARESNQAKLDERYQELATLTNLLQQEERQTDTARENVSWLTALAEQLLRVPRWWALMPEHWRNRRLRRYLQDIGIFDGDGYLLRYADVVAEGIDPLQHYLKHGLGEGRLRNF